MIHQRISHHSCFVDDSDILIVKVNRKKKRRSQIHKLLMWQASSSISSLGNENYSHLRIPFYTKSEMLNAAKASRRNEIHNWCQIGGIIDDSCGNISFEAINQGSCQYCMRLSWYSWLLVTWCEKDDRLIVNVSYNPWTNWSWTVDIKGNRLFLLAWYWTLLVYDIII